MKRRQDEQRNASGGKLPDGWEMWKVTHGFNKVGSGTTPKSDKGKYYGGDIPWITTAELRETIIYDTDKALTTEALHDYPTLKIFPEGSVAIAMYGATIGRLGILGLKATVNQACCVFSQPTKFHPKFFYYWLWMKRPILISMSVGGGQPNLSQDDLKQLRVAIPHVEAQRKIAKFLDHKTSQIDRLIKKKQELLALLEEKRTAMITKAVTKGLRPGVPMKDSGIDWLGDVPEHWKVTKFKFLLTETLKYGANEAAVSTDRDQPRFIRITDLNNDGSLREDSFKSLSEEKAKPFLLADGDILLARSGATVGKSFVYKSEWGKAAFAGYLIRARLQKKFSPDFIGYFLQSTAYKSWVQSVFIQATIQNISAEKYANLFIAVPPSEEEQHEIVAELNGFNHQINRAMRLTKKSISKLQEYKSAVITAAVTGKLHKEPV